MIEQHSATSLAARVGMSRTALQGAILSGRIPAKKTTIGAREIYSIESASIEKYKGEVLRKLQARVAKITTDPVRAKEITGSALADLRKQAESESGVWTPRKLADHFGIGLEAASYVLNRYAERTENGFKVSPSAMKAIEKHIRETRGGGTIRSKGGVYVG
jgi:hypothetical protein